jgi:hypothetical protein
MSRYINLTVDVEIDMDDIETSDLIKELSRRKQKIEDDQINKTEFSSIKEMLNHFKKCLGLREFHTKERIIKEIQEL